MSLPTDLVAFLEERRRCRVLDGGVAEPPPVAEAVRADYAPGKGSRS